MKLEKIKDQILYGLRAFLNARHMDTESVEKEKGLGEIKANAQGDLQRPLKGKTIFITGGSRGIGLEIALKAARDGANVVIAAKTTEPHPKLPGTIFTAASEIEKAGGKCLALKLDVRDGDQIKKIVDQAAEHFGGIDILLNNASAIFLEKTPHLSMKQFDLMQQVNTRGTFFASQACYPHLKKSSNPHILVLSPPINFSPPWLEDHLGYTLSKYGMSMCVVGLSREWKKNGIAVNALWPRTTIATAAVKNMPMGEMLTSMSRHPRIMADAAYQILIRDSQQCTGKFFLDDEVLRGAGVTDLEQYSVNPGSKLQVDLFL